jgi:hypothetical protein
MMELCDTLNTDWLVPAFLANEYAPEGTALAPVMEILCVDLRYPAATVPSATGLIAQASGNSMYYYTSTAGTFMGVSPRVAPAAQVQLAITGGTAVFGDADAVHRVRAAGLPTASWQDHRQGIVVL